VYRAADARDIDAALQGSKLFLKRIDLAGAAGKKAMLERIARALDFPDWFGGNWDALEDCLGDLSWTRAEGHVLLFADAPATDARATLVDVLRSTAAAWAERKRPFFAVFIGTARDLPPLYREKR
jgi:hypothetical protein